MEGGGKVLYSRFTLRLKTFPPLPRVFASPNGCRSPAATRVQQPTDFGLRRQPTDTRATKNWTSLSFYLPRATIDADTTQTCYLRREKLHILLLAQQTACALPHDSIFARCYSGILQKNLSGVAAPCDSKERKQREVSPLVFSRS